MWRWMAGLLALAATPVAGYFAFQTYLKWLMSEQSSPAGHERLG